MQKKYSIAHLIERPNPRVWPVLLQWLVVDWLRGHETVSYSDDVYELWSPVQSETEEFPH